MRQKIQLLSIVLCICAFSCEAKDTKDPIHYQVYNSNKFSTVHVLIVDTKLVKIIAARAQDIGQGLCTVGHLAKEFNARAGINGGFFRVNRKSAVSAVPAGILKINGAWHGIAYKPRGAIAWDPETNNVLVDIVQTRSSVVLNDQSLPVNAMNQIVRGNKAILLSDSFRGPIDTQDGLSLVILNQHVEAVYNAGVLQVPQNAYIYKIPDDLAHKLGRVVLGDMALIKIQVQPQLDKKSINIWNKMPFIVGGGPLLIKSGKKHYDYSQEEMDAGFISGRHARTAIGVLSDKRFVFIVAERDILEEKPGVTIAELRDFAYQLGCVAALNLDGGSSSTMYIEDIKHALITDQPVADAILMVSRQ